MKDLITFLRERLNEDEQTARNATWCEDAGTWRTGSAPYGTRGAAQRWYIEDSMEDGVVSHVDPQASDDEGVARHITRFDPARVLREVAAKRRILDEHAIAQTKAAGEGLRVVEIDVCQTCSNKHGVPCQTVRLLALPYADHEGYREEWRPS